MKHHSFVSAVLYSHVFLSLCALICVWGTWSAFPQGSLQIAYGALVFASTFLTYNAKSLYLLTKEQPTHWSEKLRWAGEHHNTLGWSCALAIAIIFLAAYYLPMQLLVCLSFLSVVAFAYFFPIPIFGFTIRSIPFMKTATVAGVWTVTTSYLPILLIGGSPSWQNLLSAGMIYYALAILFDIKDIQNDQEKKIVTWASLMGVRGTLLLSSALIVVRAIVLLMSNHTALLLFSAMLSIAIMVLVVKKYPVSELRYMFFIDGLLIVHALI